MKKCFMIVGMVSLFAMAGVFCAYLYGIRAYVVLSGSMEPTISTGSVCLVDTGASYGKIKEKDVVAYEKKSGILITHRAVKKTADGWITKGDANEDTDGLSVTSKNFRGKTLFAVPYLGYFLFGMRKYRLWIAGICIAATIAGRRYVKKTA